MSQLEIIEKKIRSLDDTSLSEVNRLVDSLLKKKTPGGKNDWVYSRQTWAGALKDITDQYTSIELQKKSLDWWTEDVSR